jgi:hypothetical protein
VADVDLRKSILIDFSRSKKTTEATGYAKNEYNDGIWDLNFTTSKDSAQVSLLPRKK